MYMYMSFVSFDVFITSTAVQGVCNLSASITSFGGGGGGEGEEERRRKIESEGERRRERGGREGGRESREVESHFAISLCRL